MGSVPCQLNDLTSQLAVLSYSTQRMLELQIIFKALGLLQPKRSLFTFLKPGDCAGSVRSTHRQSGSVKLTSSCHQQQQAAAVRNMPRFSPSTMSCRYRSMPGRSQGRASHRRRRSSNKSTSTCIPVMT